MRRDRIIVMEFNELCPPLLDRWMAAGHLPNFRKLAETSDVFVSEADVEDPGQLEPWIQWYSAHTGLSYAQHRVFHLTDGPRAGHEDVFQALIAAGKRVMSFGSMNVRPFRAPGSVFVGDPWSENGDASPDELNTYNGFVSRQVREYSNAANRFGLSDYARFVSFVARSGLRPGTVAAILDQLTRERTVDKRLSYRRVALMDALNFDVFSHYYDANRPHFATFFANSTAHLQHSYWRHMDPGPFRVRPGDEEMRVYGDAVLFGYRAMDRLVGRFMALADRSGATLMFMTALSQQPFVKHEDRGGQHFHRLKSVEALLKRLGIAYADVDPTMTHQYLATFAHPGEATAARARLEALELEDGRGLFGFAGGTRDGLYFGCEIFTRIPESATVIDKTTGERMTFGSILYKIEAIKSGRHHPHGALWLRTGAGVRHERPASILDVFPTVMDLIGVTPATGERRGASLVARLGRIEEPLPLAA